jgi:hypothetical protein
MRELSLKWPSIITLSVAAVEVLVYNDMETPVRPLVTLWFLMICPGMAYVRLLGLQDVVAEVVLAVVLSLVLALITASVILYTGHWSPELILMILITLSVVGVTCQLLQWLRIRTQGSVGQS